MKCPPKSEPAGGVAGYLDGHFGESTLTLIPRAGFEPALHSLKGRVPRPLAERGKLPRVLCVVAHIEHK